MRLLTKTSNPANKKIRNATPNIVDGIKFKSKLESYTYNALKEAGIEAEYENHKYTLLEPFKYMTESVRGMTYTPDFVGDGFIIECKGYGNDAWPIRWKLFKHSLYRKDIELDLYIVKNQREVKELVETLKLKGYGNFNVSKN